MPPRWPAVNSVRRDMVPDLRLRSLARPDARNQLRPVLLAGSPRPGLDGAQNGEYRAVPGERQSLPETIVAATSGLRGEHLLAAEAVDDLVDHLDPEPRSRR